MNDFKFAFRQLLKNPGFTAVAVLTLALGVGANTAVCSVITRALLEMVRHAQQEGTARQAHGRTNLAFASYRTRNPSRTASREAFGSKLQNVSHTKTRAEAI